MKAFSYKETLFALAGAFVVLIVVATWPWTGTSAELAPAPAAVAEAQPVAEVPVPTLLPYVEVTDSCGPYFEGGCVNVRSGAGTNSPAVFKVRAGAVLAVDGSVENEGRTWYHLTFNEWLRYPERVAGDLYVAGDFVTPFFHEGPKSLDKEEAPSTDKRIVVDRSDQKLYAYEGDTLYMEESISTGLELTPTPRGTFKIFWKTPSRYMQGPIPGISDDSYDLPGVPWNLYFTEQGAAIHGAYWHDHFGTQWSHGCVNLPPEKAKELYAWAELGTQVIVRD